MKDYMLPMSLFVLILAAAVAAIPTDFTFPFPLCLPWEQPCGTECCTAPEVCTPQGCCPPSQVVNGQCCPPTSHTCCPAGSISRCYLSGIEHCQNNQWIYTPCGQYETCTLIPIQNAGVYCTTSPFCTPGEPARCYKQGVQTCGANGRWTYNVCPDFYFCTHPPVEGKTNAYCQAPAPCAKGQESYCYKGGVAECTGGKWVSKACPTGTFCLKIPVAGAGIACVAPPK